MKYYVYHLIDPRDDSVFYVGKGQGNRSFSEEKKRAIADKKRESMAAMMVVRRAAS